MIVNRVMSKVETASIFRFLLVVFTILVFITLTLIFQRDALCAQVTLAWDPESAPGLAGYKLYYGTASRNYSFTADAGMQTTYTVTGLTGGATYCFAATAYGAAGTESTFSNEVCYAAPLSCSYVITPAIASYTGAGGTGSVTVATSGTCNWTTANAASWVIIASGASGRGNGTVRYFVPANTGSDSRTAGLTIAGAAFSVTQAGASSYTLTISNASAGGSGTVTTNPSGTSFSAGTSVTLTTSPGWGSLFSGWSGACSGTSRTCTVTMNADASVTATFGSQWGH